MEDNDMLVTFTTKAYANITMFGKGQCKTRTLRGEDLLWLLMQHVLPRGFHRARDYGFLHPYSKSLLKQVQLWFSINPPAPAPEPSKDCPRCPVCGATEVIRTLFLARP